MRRILLLTSGIVSAITALAAAGNLFTPASASTHLSSLKRIRARNTEDQLMRDFSKRAGKWSFTP